MFKKTLLATAATAALLGPVAAFAAGDMGQGFINFTGSVTEAPCSILAADSNLAVDLGQVSKTSLGTANSHGNSVPIEIHMTGCSFAAPTGGTAPSSKIEVTFPGQTSTNGIVPNTMGDATNVGIQLLKADGSTNYDFTTEGTGVQMHDGNNVLSFFARIAKSGTGNVTAGSVSSKVAYMLKYK
ncbi:fimbrial protein [Achromobacter xylosoxidans]|uniref:fimbrial protein n=1 Tax=Alcaligenes xylosoxydans xylosoxydans TaxID=85698 RepID=UPI003255991C